jgi:hypothetical protein
MVKQEISFSLAATDILGRVQSNARSRRTTPPAGVPAAVAQESRLRRFGRAALPFAILLAILAASFALRTYVYVRMP